MKRHWTEIISEPVFVSLVVGAIFLPLALLAAFTEWGVYALIGASIAIVLAHITYRLWRGEWYG